jgi:protein-L-isoaspartate(D-aspartate) O-methyltransferase
MEHLNLNSLSRGGLAIVFLYLTFYAEAFVSLGRRNVSEETSGQPLQVPYAQDKFHEQRNRMVSEQISDRGVKDQQVLNAMRKVSRHLFVPEHSIERAYNDGPLPIGYGQTISQPYIVAYMTELLGVAKDDTVLEIGTGSGYQAAVLAEIVSKVYTIEIIKELGESAKERLKRLGYSNVEVKVADGYYGWEEHAPFDAIIVTAAAEHIPPPLIKQLKEGGRMAIPVGHAFAVQNLMFIEKKQGKVISKNVLPVRFVPLVGTH